MKSSKLWWIIVIGWFILFFNAPRVAMAVLFWTCPGLLILGTAHMFIQNAFKPFLKDSPFDKGLTSLGGRIYSFIWGTGLLIAAIGLPYVLFLSNENYSYKQHKNYEIDNIVVKQAQYIARRHYREFHTLSCKIASEITWSNAIFYKNREDAIKSGRIPCEICKP